MQKGGLTTVSGEEEEVPKRRELVALKKDSLAHNFNSLHDLTDSFGEELDDLESKCHFFLEMNDEKEESKN